MLGVLFVSDGPLKKMPKETHHGIVNVRSVTPEIIDRAKGTPLNPSDSYGEGELRSPNPDIVIICGEVEQWVLDEIHALNPDTILKR